MMKWCYGEMIPDGVAMAVRQFLINLCVGMNFVVGVNFVPQDTSQVIFPRTNCRSGQLLGNQLSWGISWGRVIIM